MRIIDAIPHEWKKIIRQNIHHPSSPIQIKTYNKQTNKQARSRNRVQKFSLPLKLARCQRKIIRPLHQKLSVNHHGRKGFKNKIFA